MADTLTRNQQLTIGPQHQGKRMSLARFAHADATPGHCYELERGTIVVVDVPGVPHGRAVAFVRTALTLYQHEHPDSIDYIGGGTDSVVRMWELQSERHPDVTVYLNPPPTNDEQAWDEWTPDIVVEIVSRQSRRRDYGMKREDYLAAGVRQYWIIDPPRQSATILVRRGDTWRPTVLDRKGIVRTSLLRGFALRLSELFAIHG
jgi:Uma2 family endonuclease